jgi:hypothetical membrane protein
MMNLKILQLAGFFGMVAPLFGLMMVGMSIWISPWFNWSMNALSDLGVQGFESVVFNSGLAMTAALIMMFSTGLFEMTKGDIVGQMGSILYLLSCFLLLGIGIANETIEPWHYYVSVGFFVVLPLAVTVIGFFCFKRGMRFYALISWGAAVLAAAIWVLHWQSPAIPEALSVTYIAVWEVLLGYWMYTRVKDKLEE